MIARDYVERLRTASQASGSLTVWCDLGAKDSMRDPGLSLVIVQYGQPSLLWNLLRSFQRHPDRGLIGETVVVDNGCSMSVETRCHLARQFKDLPLRFVDNEATSYAVGVNSGVQATAGDIVIVSNNDVEWLAAWSIEPLLRRMIEKPCIGVGGGQLVYPDGSWQRSFGKVPSIREALGSVLFMDTLANILERRRFSKREQESRPVGYVDGAFMVIRRKCFEELGGLDETFSFYAEETDFCYRARRAGWKIVFEPQTRILHVRGASSSAQAGREFAHRLVRAKLQFVRQHSGTPRSAVYRKLLTIALRERIAVYATLGRARDSFLWMARAAEARERLMALTGRTGVDVGN